MRWIAALAVVLALAACGSKPPAPHWLVEADGAQERFVRAYLAGRDRVADAEFARLRREVASTAQPALVARVELARCAVRVASLDFAPCTGFEALRGDASPAERAYADFLAGTLAPADAALLPEVYRAIAAGTADAAQLARVEDPVSRLVAAGVLLRMRRADAGVLDVATETASAQGWRRAVLAWLAAQVVAAERTGATEQAARLRRRMAIAAEAD